MPGWNPSFNPSTSEGCHLNPMYNEPGLGSGASYGSGTAVSDGETASMQPSSMLAAPVLVQVPTEHVPMPGQTKRALTGEMSSGGARARGCGNGARRMQVFAEPRLGRGPRLALRGSCCHGQVRQGRFCGGLDPKVSSS